MLQHNMLRLRRIAGFHQLSQLQVTPLWHLPVDICLWTFPAHLNYAETQHEFNILTSFLKWIWSKLSRTASGFQLSRFLLKLGQNLVKAKKSMKFTAHLNYPVIQHKLNQIFFHLEPSSSPDFWSTSGQFFCITQNFRPNSVWKLPNSKNQTFAHLRYPEKRTKKIPDSTFW